MKLSVVTTLYCSENYIVEYHERISKAISELVGVGEDYEIVLVDDGSPDNSLNKALAIAALDSRTMVIELSKNHGHHRAMWIGLNHSKGERVFLIDCDLEESPETLLEFWAESEANLELDLIYGVEEKKGGNWAKKTLSLAFYRVFNHFSYIQIADNELLLRLMSRGYVDALMQYTERELFLPGIWKDAGFRRKQIKSVKDNSAESSYTLSRRVTMAIDAITSFSTKPLLYVFYLGFFMSFFSFLVAIVLVFKKLFMGGMLGGWTSILVSLYLIGGIIIFSVGAVGLYLSRIFTEVKQRPPALIRKIHRSGESDEQ